MNAMPSATELACLCDGVPLLLDHRYFGNLRLVTNYTMKQEMCKAVFLESYVIASQYPNYLRAEYCVINNSGELLCDVSGMPCAFPGL